MDFLKHVRATHLSFVCAFLVAVTCSHAVLAQSAALPTLDIQKIREQFDYQGAGPPFILHFLDPILKRMPHPLRFSKGGYTCCRHRVSSQEKRVLSFSTVLDNGPSK